MLPHQGRRRSGRYRILGSVLSPDWLEVGKYTYYGRDMSLGVWTPGERIIIGKYCSIADEVVILTGGEHRTDLASTYPLDMAAAWMGGNSEWLYSTRTYQTTRNTTIGNDVWIGLGAMILGGVSLGSGAVVASGSVVFSDVPPYAIVAGNPAKVLRHRFSNKTVERLLRIAWWDWPDEKVLANVEWFYRPITEFVEHFDR